MQEGLAERRRCINPSASGMTTGSADRGFADERQICAGFLSDPTASDIGTRESWARGAFSPPTYPIKSMKILNYLEFLKARSPKTHQK